MPASGSPEIEAPGMNGTDADRYAPTAWGSRYQDLTVPSGQTCQVRKLSLEDLVMSGMIDDLDSLSKYVEEKHIQVKAKALAAKGPAAKKKNQDSGGLLGGISSDDLRKMIKLLDEVVLATVVKPELHKSIPEEDRREDHIYLDDIDIGDKMVIMQHAFEGVKNLEQFRDELATSAASLDDVKDLEAKPESDSRDSG